MKLGLGTKRLADQSGWSIFEMVIALFVCGVLGGGIFTTIYQISSVNSIDNARVTAVKQVESAVHYLNRDIQMSQYVLADGEDYWLRMGWTSWDDNQTVQIVYTVVDTQLIRTYSVNDIVQTSASVAHNITDVSAEAPDLSATPPEKTWEIQVTACTNFSLKEATETRLIYVIPRPGA